MKRLGTTFGVALAVGLLAGCKDNSITTLSGKVTLDGQPFETGIIIFYSPVEGCVSERVHDGQYEVRNPPLGEVVIVLSDGSTPMLPDWKPDPKSFRPGAIPPQYLTKETSPLKVEVKQGQNNYDVALVSPR